MLAQKLRDALTEMDESDLDNHVQRTADWLRSGINPNSNGTESEIAQGLEKLGHALQQAQQAMGNDKGVGRDAAQGDDTAALDQIERLRSQIDAMSGSRQGSRGKGGTTQDKNEEQPGSGQRGAANAAGQSEERGLRRDGAGSDRNPAAGQSNAQGIARGGDLGGQSGAIRSSGGRGEDGTAWKNFNTGNNRYARPGQSSSAAGNADTVADPAQSYEQGIRELNQLRHMIQADPQAAKDVAELARQMRQLDPSRFPGNPAMVEAMHREVLSTVDRIELQLQHDSAASGARTGKPFAVPAGYQDAVADYYRRLSANPQGVNR